MKNEMEKSLKIAVIGSDVDHCSGENEKLALMVGKEIAMAGAILYTGGGEGVMRASSKGARSKGGKVVGVIPGTDKKIANKYCTEIIAPGEDFFRRSVTMIEEIDGVIIIDGGVGTLSEMCYAYWYYKPMVALKESGGMAELHAGKFLDKRYLSRIGVGNNAKDTVTKVIEMAQNKKDMESRLIEVGLSLEIFRKRPNKYVRINPRNPIKIEALKEKLEKDYGLKTEFTETGVKGIYESSNPDIGGTIHGKKNSFFNNRYFIQDLASVICIEELDLEEGQSLLETCAARGFKSLYAHDITRGKIDITALDIDPDKYKIMLGFFKKFGLKAKTKLTDATMYQSNKRYDRVLVDAPCSSEGMTVSYDGNLGKDISGFDAVIKFSEKDVDNLVDLQSKLLQNGFEHLKNDGILIYATCTLNKKENEEVVEKFLKRNDDAEVVSLDMTKYNIDHESSELGVRILPGKTKGFYFAKIKRKL